MHSFFNLIKRYGHVAFFLLILITLAFRYAEPVKDGDFFWHVKYGEYMVENGTLVPDHTLYSWTPTDEGVVKCNWIGDILLYMLNQAGGLNLLFAFRYACVLIMLAIVGTIIFWLGYLKKPLGWTILAVCLVSSFEAAYLKPEILSMIFMALIPLIYFFVKKNRLSSTDSRFFFLFPIIVLLWVNTHEVFLFGMVMLAMITAGEILNYWFNKNKALSAVGMRNLVLASLASVGATFVNPYGYGIHLKYWDKLIGTQDQSLVLKTVMAYVPIFHKSMRLMHFADLWVIMAILLGSLIIWMLVKQRGMDFGLLLPNLFLAAIAAKYGRAFYYWPAFWGMSVIYLVATLPLPQWDKKAVRFVLPTILCLVTVFLCGRAIYDSVYRPYLSRWLGFGIGYFNPVQSSEFLKVHKPGTRLYNSYNPGGYLIYDLYPDYKVFCDGRSFPFKSWYDEYWAFNAGPTPLDEFNQKYDFDVALVDYYASTSPIVKFLTSRNWEPAFYGPSAMVFVRKDAEFHYDFKSAPKERFKVLRNLDQANSILYIAQNLNDFDVSQYILDLMKKKFSYLGKRCQRLIKEGTLYHDGLVAFREGNLETAYQKLIQVGNHGHTPNANLALFQLRRWKAKQLIEKKQFREAMTLLETIVRNNPMYTDGLYNAGIIGYYIESQKEANSILEKHAGMRDLFENQFNWRAYLHRLLKIDPDYRYAWVAKQILDGKGIPPNVTLAL